MRSRGLVVPRERGESVRQRLAAEGWLRTDLRIRSDARSLTLPIQDGAPVPAEWGVVLDTEFDLRPPDGPADYRELLRGSAEDRARAPRSFDVVGDIVLVRIPREAESQAPEIGAALLAFVPGARIVGADRGVHGLERRRRIERLAGRGGWATVHRENGLAIDVDVERAYFSPRLAVEHARVAEEIRAGDRVYDLCCGVGPFSLHFARDGRAREVVAVDLNPAAIDLLERSQRRERFSVRITTHVASIEAFLPDRTPFERAVLNLPHEGIKYASSVAGVVAPHGRLYYYEIVPRTEFERRGDVIARTIGPRGEWTVLGYRVVHPYSPDSDLVAFTLERAGG